MNLLYSVEREFAHPVERLWATWTDAGELEAWYHPTDLQNVAGSVVSEPWVDGWWTVAVDVPAHSFIAYFYGQYTLVEPEKRLEHSMFYVESQPQFEARETSLPSAHVVIDFEHDAGKTLVRFSQFGEMPEDQIPRTKAGMESYFQSLAHFLG